MPLPSKKVINIFILAAGLVTAVIITFGGDKASTAINYANTITAGEKVSLPTNPNWQSELVLTNNPSEQAQATTTKTTPDTLTDTISKTLIGNYLVLKQNNELNQQSAQALVDQSVGIISSEEKVDSPIILNIISDNGRMSMQNYGENLGLIIKNNTSASSDEDFNALIEAIKSGDQTKINGLQKNIDIYDKVLNEMLKIPVPQSFAKTHTEMIRGLMLSSSGLKNLMSVLNDPLLGFSGLGMLREGSDMFAVAMQSTQLSIYESGIVYEQGSGGYYLIYGI
jgi:hypothetical protein